MDGKQVKGRGGGGGERRGEEGGEERGGGGRGEGRRGKRMVAGWISCKTARGCPPHYRNRQKVCIVLRQKNSLVVYGKTINNNITT